MLHRDWSSTLARIPGPRHQLVFGKVLDELIEIPVSVLLSILNRFANLRVGQSLPDHRCARRRQTPVGCARRQMRAREIMVLMARTAFFRRNPMTIRTSAHVHGVPMSVVALPRIVSLRVTIHAARVP